MKSKKKIIIISSIIAAIALTIGGVAIAGKSSSNKEETKETTAEKNAEALVIENEASKGNESSDEEADDGSDSDVDSVDAPANEGSGDNANADTSEEPAANGYIVAIDPGHQTHGDSSHEPIGPGSSETKARVTGGTTGVATGVPEYQLNLDVSLKLRDELVKRGYNVIMIRETNDVSLSNSERAAIANQAGAHAFIRVHANGSSSSGSRGALALAPSASNPYVSHIAADSQRLSQCVLDSYCSATGIGNLGVRQDDTMSGINWCQVPVTILELGFMSNPDEDTLMQNADTQAAMVQGIANGLDIYFQ